MAQEPPGSTQKNATRMAVKYNSFHHCSSLAMRQSNCVPKVQVAHLLASHHREDRGLNTTLISSLSSRHLTSVTSPSTPRLHKRPIRKKVLPSTGQPGIFNVTAYATADEYNIEDFVTYIEKEGLYDKKPLPSDLEGAHYLTARYTIEEEPRHIVVFRQGTVVFWNIPSEEQFNFMKSLRNYESEPYDRKIVDHEAEKMDFRYANERSEEQPAAKTRIKNNTMVFAGTDSDNIMLEKYTYSNGLMDSVKLAIWEASLAEYIESIEEVTESLREGGELKLSRKQVLQKTGELFNLSHLINLSSDLLDTPDFYWDRDQLEILYKQSQNYFSIQNRTRVMNNKLSHCLDLVDLLRDHLNTKHEVRLEWMIIVLILVEVIFEILHVYERRQTSVEDHVTPDS